MKATKLLRLTLFFVLSVIMICGSLGATGIEKHTCEVVIEKLHETTLGLGVTNDYQQTTLLPQVQAIEKLLNQSNDHYLGGIYLDGSRAVIQLVERYQNKAMLILSSHYVSPHICFETVKYSQKELQEAYENLNSALLNEEVIKGEVVYEGVWGIDTKKNGIVLMTHNERVLEKALEIIEPDMLRYGTPVRYSATNEHQNSIMK